MYTIIQAVQCNIIMLYVNTYNNQCIICSVLCTICVHLPAYSKYTVKTVHLYIATDSSYNMSIEGKVLNYKTKGIIAQQ